MGDCLMMMRKIDLLLFVSVLSIFSTSAADARSCTDVLNSCLKMYNVTRSAQSPSDPTAVCRTYHNSCMQTGAWSSPTVNLKGLEKK